MKTLNPTYLCLARRWMTADSFLAAKPTEIITVHGITFYEDPEEGDEAPLWAVVGSWAFLTDAWDTGDLENDSGIFADE